jgi:hypothetical protein
MEKRFETLKELVELAVEWCDTNKRENPPIHACFMLELSGFPRGNHYWIMSPDDYSKTQVYNGKCCNTIDPYVKITIAPRRDDLIKWLKEN